MNLVLLFEQQFISESTAELNDRQQQHLAKIVKAQHGDLISVGRINGNTGKGTLNTQTSPWQIEVSALNTPAPPRLPLTLILALPRPQMIKRIMQTVATMGVNKIVLIQTAKVEKSFWQSPAVTDEALYSQLVLGMEQGVDTVAPTIEKHRRFRPFAEDVLPTYSTTSRWIAHPGPFDVAPHLPTTHEHIVAIGPEGGFTAQEVAYFVQAGFNPFHLGKRILKVETAVPVILSALFSI